VLKIQRLSTVETFLKIYLQNVLRKLIRKLSGKLIRKLSKQLGCISSNSGEAAVRRASR
jgi:hypothetical protein